jgi:nicotinate-nucleotide adenylyltransferase
MKELGIMGGYFNPIHNWHLILGDWAADQFSLDKVLYVPSGTPPHAKKHIMDGNVRFKMVAIAIADNPRFEASRIEIDRPGVTWTIDTLRELKKRYGPGVRLNFIIGEDNIKAIRDYELRDELLALCRLLVACRGEADDERVKSWRAELPQADIEAIDCPASELSSTMIRDLIVAGKPYRYLVPASVYHYIEKHRLYRSAPNAVTGQGDSLWSRLLRCFRWKRWSA